MLSDKATNESNQGFVGLSRVCLSEMRKNRFPCSNNTEVVINRGGC